MTPRGQFGAGNRLPPADHLNTQPGVLRASRTSCGRWRADGLGSASIFQRKDPGCRAGATWHRDEQMTQAFTNRRNEVKQFAIKTVFGMALLGATLLPVARADDW